MAIVWRAMSYEEFATYTCGAPVVGRYLFKNAHNSFHGKGVCFFKNPSNCALWSSAKKYVICKFKIADELLFKGSGCYPDFDSDDWDDCLDIEEYSMKEYSKETAEFTRLHRGGFICQRRRCYFGSWKKVSFVQ